MCVCVCVCSGDGLSQACVVYGLLAKTHCSINWSTALWVKNIRPYILVKEMSAVCMANISQGCTITQTYITHTHTHTHTHTQYLTYYLHLCFSGTILRPVLMMDGCVFFLVFLLFWAILKWANRKHMHTWPLTSTCSHTQEQEATLRMCWFSDKMKVCR